MKSYMHVLDGSRVFASHLRLCLREQFLGLPQLPIGVDLCLVCA